MSDNFVELSYSDDGGHNWSNWRQADLGATGAYQTRVRFWRLGTCIQRVFRIRLSSPINADILAASIQVDSAP